MHINCILHFGSECELVTAHQLSVTERQQGTTQKHQVHVVLITAVRLCHTGWKTLSYTSAPQRLVTICVLQQHSLFAARGNVGEWQARTLCVGRCEQQQSWL